MMSCNPCSPNSSTPDIGGIEDGKRRFEQIFQLDFARRHATIFQQRKILRLFRRDIFGDQPRLEIFRDFLFLGLEFLQPSACRMNSIMFPPRAGRPAAGFPR